MPLHISVDKPDVTAAKSAIDSAAGTVGAGLFAANAHLASLGQAKAAIQNAQQQNLSAVALSDLPDPNDLQTLASAVIQVAGGYTPLSNEFAAIKNLLSELSTLRSEVDGLKAQVGTLGDRANTLSEQLDACQKKMQTQTGGPNLAAGVGATLDALAQFISGMPAGADKDQAVQQVNAFCEKYANVPPGTYVSLPAAAIMAAGGLALGGLGAWFGRGYYDKKKGAGASEGTPPAEATEPEEPEEEKKRKRGKR
jgi:hypothetical protein